MSEVPDEIRTGLEGGFEFRQVVVRAVANSHDLEGLTRPLLEALTKLSGFESTYLVVFDWDRHEQQVRFVHNTNSSPIAEGVTTPLAEGVSKESLLGLSGSPSQLGTSPACVVARSAGLNGCVSVPITVAHSQLFGMVCGASQAAGVVAEKVVSVMEFFAQMIADHVTRAATAATAARADRAEAQLRARAQFLAEAEHQLKTPLAVLRGASATLLEHWPDLADDKRTELLSMVVRNTAGLSRRVDELLVEARADAQARALIPVRLELGPFVSTIVSAFGVVSAFHSVVAEVEPGIFLEADPVPLYEVLGHLLDNAVKYSPDGGAIKVRVTRTLEAVQIDVVDEGIGVPDGVDVFEAFRRGEPSDVGAMPGIGLGLHIVRNLVVAMGGSVTARKNAERGSTFMILLPAMP